jgi:hypothetical protein
MAIGTMGDDRDDRDDGDFQKVFMGDFGQSAYNLTPIADFSRKRLF